jgi:hypothetical protein
LFGGIILKNLKGKKVFSVEIHKHLYYKNTIRRLDIKFTDGTVLHVQSRPHTNMSVWQEEEKDDKRRKVEK